MQTFSVTVSPNMADSFNRRLDTALTEKGVLFIRPHTNRTEYEFSFPNHENQGKKMLAETLCQLLLTEYRKAFTLDYAARQAGCLSESEFKQLKERLNSAQPHVPGKDLLKENILDVLEDFGRISPEGFFRFRMQSEQAVWKCTVNMLLDEMIIERDYETFIELMRVFLEVQDPKADVVHLFVHNGTIRIFDEDMHAYDTRQLKEIAKDISAAPGCEDDLSVSILLALAPRAVVIHHHNEEDPPALKTIRKVFSDRISN